MARAALSLPPEMPRMCRTEVLPTGCLSVRVVGCAVLRVSGLLLDHQGLCELGEEHFRTFESQACGPEREGFVHERCEFVLRMLVSPNDGCMVSAIRKRDCYPYSIERSTRDLRLREMQTLDPAKSWAVVR